MKAPFPTLLHSGCLSAAALFLVACDPPRPSAERERGSGQELPQAEASAATTAFELPETVGFNDHIQPILSEYCYQCHGPDAGTREPAAEPLRLDLAEAAFAPRDGAPPVIIPGDPAASEIIRLMRHPDSSIVMPPPEAHKTMNEREIALVERWIEQGAEYQNHWAYEPVVRPEPPAAGEAWSPHPVDRFLFERMAAEGLEPNPPEDPARFHRRLALDLTGLPPAPEETAAFLEAHATDPDAAVSAEAERMLAGDSSAEHFARHWLDAARYADTHGIHIDNYRAIWPYRDWVIRAFRDNLPWDVFTIEQVAGDLLPERTLDQHIATGFSRCMATTGEGGAINDEYAALYAQDQVDTVGAVWLGLTASCAACHDHKFDPLSTREFYSLTAFFRNTTMPIMDGNNAEHPPVIFAPRVEDRERWTVLGGEIDATRQALAAREAEAGPDFASWLENANIELPPDIDSTLALHLPLSEAEGPLSGTADGEALTWDATEAARIDGPLGPALVVSGGSVELGDLASFSREHTVTYGGFIRIEGEPTGAVIARMNPAEGFRGWDLYLQGGRPAAHVIDTWDRAANKITASEPLAPGEWHHVMVVFDGRQAGHQSISLFVNGERVQAGPSPNTVGGRIETRVPLRLGSREGGDSALTGPVALQDFRFYRRLLSHEEISQLARNSSLNHILSVPEEQRSEEQNAHLFRHFITQVDEPTRQLRGSLESLVAEQSTLRERGSMTLVMEERADSEPHAHVLNRGVYTDLGERVTPDTPAYLPPMPEDAPRDRLGLAQWLVDPANPLPARVTMNRTWYYFFGIGIVETTEDFGIMGARPSHPELLDWLAAEFVDSGWDYRHMLHLIATSRAYRQSGAVSAEKLEADPANLLVARGPRHRLDAEQIRDLALAASGLLAPTMGGPPVRPYQPEGIWEAVAMPQSNTRHYRPDSGEGLYRRSLYTFWKRSAAPATLEILNAPTRETFCVRRDLTNTPLQALALLNDPQFVEASRALASSALAAAGDETSREDFITTRLLSRRLDEAERSDLRATVATALAHYRSHPDQAAELLAVGETSAPPDLDPAELAAWTLAASQIFNLDETVTR